MGKMKHRGIAEIDLEQAFKEKHDESDDETVSELFNDLMEIEFVKPDLRAARRNIGRDDELFSMIT